MYKKVPSSLDFAAREKDVLEFWKAEKVFEKCQEERREGEPFTFYDGPPTANGKPHIGHILTRCIKDLFPRYKSMQGYNVMRKAGWDTHGLPVELEVERQLGLDGKEEIEKYGVEAFIKECKESVFKYKSEWEIMSGRVGFWADMDDPYITYKNDYIESVWWSLKEMHKKDLLYKGHKTVPYCPRCGTALSSHEVAQGYKDVVDTSAYVKFKVKGKEDEYFLAWTTTPWTLPSNVGLCVNAGIEYAKVLCGGEKYILAKELINTVLGEGHEILETFPGRSLEYMEYQPLFDFQRADDSAPQKGWFVTLDDYVTTTDGTGMVHIACAFGEDDYRIGQKYGLPFIQYVDPKGRMTGDTHWGGIFCKDADPLILEELDKANLLIKTQEYPHSYPFCWRCDTTLLYYARSSWFIRMTAVRDNLMANNRSVNWLPDNIKEGRMGNFLENVIDWGLSRERYWGTPLPIWECDCGHFHVIGSIAELREMGDDVPDDIELHKPYIDRVKLTCPSCGNKMTRVSDVIDCWYDSGSMPFAQWHYPFENKEAFHQRFPANYISEAIDQTRGWFYTLLAISTCIFEKSPFENCIVLGHVQDKDGKKMSKHLGNVVDPMEVLDAHGADAVRWYFYTSSMPWLPSRFYAEAVGEAQRKFMGTLWNTYAFYILYADIDSFNPMEHTLDADALSAMDKWILSRLNSLVSNVCEALDEYKITEPGREIQRFVDDLSNWYVRRCRERFWAGGMERDKINAYMTLYTVLETLARLLAPFTPFLAEDIYQNLVKSVDKNAPVSVHMCDYPVACKERIDTGLEKNMDLVLDVVALGRSARNESGIKNRQPLGVLYVQLGSLLPAMYIDIIKDELNVKKVEFIEDSAKFLTYKIKPQLKTLGPKYGKLLPKINQYLQTADGNAVVEAFGERGTYKFELDGQAVELSEADTLIEPMHREGYVAMKHGNIAVVLDIRLNDELIKEGLVREIISKVQTMRKEAGFNVTDHIRLYHWSNGDIASVIGENSGHISKVLLADEISAGEGGAYRKEWDINSHQAQFGIEVI